MSKTVIVTGASRGLGAATAAALVERGANVVLNARSQGALQEVAGEMDPAGEQTLVVAGDVGDTALCRKLVAQAVARFGRLDGLVNNAGVLRPIAPLAESDPAGWRTNLAVNVLGPAVLTHFALPHLRAGRGRVVNVSSGAAVKAMAGWSAYCTAKAALNHLTRVLAVEEPAVVALALRPGVVDTAMQAAIREEGDAGMPAGSYERFIRYHEEGELLPPKVPGRVLAVLALHAPHEWSGEFVQWNEERVQGLLREFDGHGFDAD